MKKLCALFVVVLMLMCVTGCGDSDINDQGNGGIVTTLSPTIGNQNVGQYSVTIDGCRLAKDYDGKDVVIVKYTFTNVSDDEPASFMWSMSDKVFQDGISLDRAIVSGDEWNYDSDNQMKEIKKGASIQLEVAYELNDTTSNIEVEVSEMFGWSDTVIKKVFQFK